MTFGSPHRHFRVTDSTNARARELVETGAPGGSVVTAAEQTAGRGRQGRSWTAPAGKALLYSAVLRPLDERHMLLPLAVPLAVCEAAEELKPEIECRIKWPNDIWVEERKLAGVLIEAKPQDGWAVIGIGLNLTIEPDEFPPQLRDTAASLNPTPPSRSAVPYLDMSGRRHSGTKPPGSAVPSPHQVEIRNSARRGVDLALERWVAADREEVLAAWRERDALRGRQVSWEDGSGVADGIDDRGHLAVAVAGGGRLLLGAGDVHLRL